MKIPEIDRRSFLNAVGLYRRLPPGARRFFVEKVQPSQGFPSAVMGEWREALLDSRLMVAGRERQERERGPAAPRVLPRDAIS